jgi:hypothetical protein
VPPDGFHAPIALLLFVNQHFTIGLLRVGLYSGATEIAFYVL